MWVPNVESFEDAAALDRAQLQIVLDSGRPEQRVWAIWALALRTGGQVGAIGGRAPDAGARRTLAVVLAGHGEVSALIELATRDPDVYVRETAMQLVTRLAAGGAIKKDVVEGALEQDPAIRVAALGAIGRGAPKFLVSIAHRLLRDPNIEIAGEAFEALLRLETTEGRDAARVWLLRRPDPWSFVARWLRAGDMLGLADAMADSAMTIRGRVLEQLRAPPWEVVQLLVGKDLELLRAVLGRTDIAIPSAVLARAILRGAHAGFAQRLVQQLATAGDGRALLDSLRAAIAAELDGGRLRTLWARVRRYADAVEISERGALLDDIVNTHPVEQLLGLENAVARWVAEYEAPPDLLLLIDELRPYCEQLRERLQLAGADRPRPGRARLGAAAARPRDDHESYRDLVDLIAALDRLRANI
jgi:hypothetical protein